MTEARSRPAEHPANVTEQVGQLAPLAQQSIATDPHRACRALLDRFQRSNRHDRDMGGLERRLEDFGGGAMRP
jgi:hypothetical protein